MSNHNMNTMMTNREMALAVLALPFQAIAKFFRYMWQNTSRMATLAQLQNVTDEELEAKGLTRAQAVQRVLRSQF